MKKSIRSQSPPTVDIANGEAIYYTEKWLGQDIQNTLRSQIFRKCSIRNIYVGLIYVSVSMQVRK